MPGCLGGLLYRLGVLVAVAFPAYGLYGLLWGDRPAVAVVPGIVPGLAVLAVVRILRVVLAGR